MRPWLPLLAAFAPGCLDYSFFGRKDVTDTGEALEPFDIETVPAEAAPCVEAWSLPDDVPVDESCVHEPDSGPLEVVVEWRVEPFENYAEYGHVLMAPVVGQLTDDDGNGRIDERDDPDVVTVADDDGRDASHTHGVLRIHRGTDGALVTTFEAGTWDEAQVYPYRYGGVALGDVDGDGLPELVTVVELVYPPEGGGGGDDTAPPSGGDDTAPEVEELPVWLPPPTPAGPTCYLAAWAPDGTVEWVATGVPLACAGHAPALADLEGDGGVEVLLGAAVVDGQDGRLLWDGGVGDARYAAYTQVGEQSFALDLDGDGLGEVLAGRAVYEASGVRRCEIDPALDDGFPAAADFDLDGDGEFVLVGNGRAHVHAHDCRTLAEWVLVGEGNGGPPTVADFDGDGFPEIGIAEASTYTVYEADGTVLWSAPTVDASSHATGSSVFDFDGDGRAEVVYGDETSLWIFDGPTGAVRLQDSTHTSRTLHEYPVAVDVDADGQIEIVVPQGGGHHGVERSGLYVLGSARGDWLGDRQVWNQHAFSLTNVGADLSIPRGAPPNWPTYNTFRSGDLQPLSGGRAADALGYAAACTAPCEDGYVQIAVKLGNGGMAEMRGNVPVSVYAQVGEERVYLATERALTTLQPGETARLVRFDLDADLFPEGVAYVVLDDRDGVQQLAECHEDNNGIRLEGLGCPAAR